MKRVPADYLTTRESLHAVAEHVMSPAMYASIGKIGLRPHIGGFATQEFDGRVVAIENGVLVDGPNSLPLEGATLRAAAGFLGIEPQSLPVYEPATPLDPDAPLSVGGDSAAFLGHWYWFVNAVLGKLVTEADDASVRQIWPEHFDLACDFGDAVKGQRANYGGSPGDAAYPEPYLYVGPFDIDAVKAKKPSFFTDSWGSALHYEELRAAPDAMELAIEFMRAGRDTVRP